MKKLILILLISTKAFGCSFNTDCNIGSVCLKQGYSIYGVCVGGMNPGNSYDQQPVQSYNPNRNTGTTCNWDTDCSFGQSCLKGAYQIRGVCY